MRLIKVFKEDGDFRLTTIIIFTGVILYIVFQVYNPCHWTCTMKLQGGLINTTYRICEINMSEYRKSQIFYESENITLYKPIDADFYPK